MVHAIINGVLNYDVIISIYHPRINESPGKNDPLLTISSVYLSECAMGIFSRVLCIGIFGALSI